MSKPSDDSNIRNVKKPDTSQSDAMKRAHGAIQAARLIKPADQDKKHK